MNTLNIMPPILIAEVAQAHEGSLGMTHSMIDSVSQSGASHIKFQMHYADQESSPEDSFRVNIFPQDKSRYDYWKRMEFTPDQWKNIFLHCHEKNLKVVVSPFSIYALNLCKSLNVDIIKIGSGEISNINFLKRISSDFKQSILSTGMSRWREIDEAFSVLNSPQHTVSILQCTSEYPCPLSKIGLNNIKEIKERYNCLSGLSDHSGKIAPALAAFSQGFTDIIEVHVTYSRNAFGPDATSSLEFEELKQLKSLLDDIYVLQSNPTSKDQNAKEKLDLKNLFGRSLYFNEDLDVGTLIKEYHISFKKPGIYIPSSEVDSIIGKRLIKKAVKGKPVMLEDLA